MEWKEERKSMGSMNTKVNTRTRRGTTGYTNPRNPGATTTKHTCSESPNPCPTSGDTSPKGLTMRYPSMENPDMRIRLGMPTLSPPSHTTTTTHIPTAYDHTLPHSISNTAPTAFNDEHDDTHRSAHVDNDTIEPHIHSPTEIQTPTPRTLLISPTHSEIPNHTSIAQSHPPPWPNQH